MSLPAHESWDPITWLMGLVSAFLLLISKHLFRNILSSLEKNEQKIENIAIEVKNKIEKISDDLSEFKVTFHKFKSQQEGVYNVALVDLEESRKQAQADRQLFLEFFKNQKTSYDR